MMSGRLFTYYKPHAVFLHMIYKGLVNIYFFMRFFPFSM